MWRPNVWPVRPLRPEAEGTELFCERASAADIEFSATPTDLSTITTICERLDGIPLAIELAAARMRSMTAADVAEPTRRPLQSASCRT